MKITYLIILYYMSLNILANCNILFINSSHSNIELLVKVKNQTLNEINLASNINKTVNLKGDKFSCDMQDADGSGEIMISSIKTRSKGFWIYNTEKKIYAANGSTSINNGSIIITKDNKKVVFLDSAKVSSSEIHLIILDMNRNQSRILSSF